MSDEIKISKQSLWKYSTFVLLAAIIIIAAFYIFPSNAGNNGGTVDTEDLSAFVSNPSLYPSLGPDNAENVVIEFSDFQCPYCTMASGIPSWVSQYASQYGDLIGVGQKLAEMAQNGDIKFVYVPMSFLGQESVYAAEAGYCANEQDKFWEMHDAIFKASDGPTENDGKYTKAKLKTIATGISGLDKTKFNSCLDSSKYLSAVQTAASQASAVVSGTPSFFVNGEKVSPGWTSIQAALK